MDHSQQKAIPLILGGVGHHAEIQITQSPVGRGEEIPCMRIGVEESVFEDLAEGALNEGVEEPFFVQVA